MARREEEEPEVLDSYATKRGIAYVIDIIITGIGPLLLALGLVMGGRMGLGMDWYFGLIGVPVFLIVLFLYFVICEGMGRCTIGTRIVGLEVALENPPEPEDGGDVKDTPIGGKALMRNAPKLLLVVGAFLTLKNPSMGCVFREFRPDEYIEAKPRRSWTPKEETAEEDLTLTDELPFPAELLNGHCPKCGTPYRLDADEGSFSGLWNYRCTWCNYPVFDHWAERRTMPGFM